MLHLHHRRSRDIDIFVNDVQVLPHLSPRLNSVVESLAKDYLEAANYIKLTMPQGEIDFIAAPYLTPEPWQERTIRGRTILLETPTEIAVKKLFYRAQDLQTRDVFDAAAVIRRYRSAMEENAAILRPKLQILTGRLEFLRKRYEMEAASISGVSPAWEPLLRRAPEVLGDFLDRLQRQPRQRADGFDRD